MKPLFATSWRVRKPLALCLLLLCSTLLLSACGGNAQLEQQAGKNKQTLDASLVHAQSIGVPGNLLQPIIQQEQQLAGTHAPLSLFSDQSANDYYTNLTKRYAQLNTQVTGLESQITQQYDYQAYQDLQNLSTLLSQRQGQNFGDTSTFSNDLTSYQQNLAKAQYPRDYSKISADAKGTTEALHLMGPAHDSLSSFEKVIGQLAASNIDVTAFNQEDQNDQQSFKKARSSDDFARLIDLINTQLNQTTTVSTVAIPYVGQVKLNQFKADVDLIKQYNGTDTSKYQTSLDNDQKALNSAKTINDFLKVSAQIDADIASIKFPLTQAQATYLLQQFHQEVANWGQSHQYSDSYNGQSYPLDYEYDQQGVGSDADYALNTAETLDDYQAAIDLINNDMLHLQMMEQDDNDKTAYNQVHQEDMTLMNHYGVTNDSEVLVVSLVEQALRYYQNGTLVRAFEITSGQYDKPSLPGYWGIYDRESPTTFKSDEPKGSAFWYPDTKINYAMLYHSGGYFFHDSWWRADYGVGTNFPHYDSGGDEGFAGTGSHGCINMAEDDIAWLYPNTNYNAQVIIY